MRASSPSASARARGDLAANVVDKDRRCGSPLQGIAPARRRTGSCRKPPSWASCGPAGQQRRSEVKLVCATRRQAPGTLARLVCPACEQSGRARVPAVEAPQALETAATQRRPRFLLDPFATASLASLRDATLAACTIAIGPEGGWSPRDRAQLIAAGFEALRLGPRVLRTETAGIAAIAALQALCGDLG